MARTATVKNEVKADENTAANENSKAETVKNEVKADKPTATDNASKAVDFDKLYIVTNKAMAGQKILGTDGNIIEFDSTGKATVKMPEAVHLSKINGYAVKEN